MQCARAIPVTWLGSDSCQPGLWGWILMNEWIVLLWNYGQNTAVSGGGSSVGWGTARRKVAGSFFDGLLGIFHWLNPSGRTMVPWSTQLLTNTNPRDMSWGVNVAVSYGSQPYLLHAPIFQKLLEPVQDCFTFFRHNTHAVTLIQPYIRETVCVIFGNEFPEWHNTVGMLRKASSTCMTGVETVSNDIRRIDTYASKAIYPLVYCRCVTLKWT